MNHLRELLEVLKSGSLLAGEMNGFTNPSLHRAMDDVERIAPNAVCFWLGDISRTLDLKVIKELCVLPFETCWFETQTHPRGAPDRRITVGMLAHQSSEGVDCGMFSKLGNNWSFDGTISGSRFNDDRMLFRTTIEGEYEALQIMSQSVRAFLSALHCSNVRQQEHAPDAKLQKARAKRGKAPLFSYWTLQLEGGKTERGADQGGTHASPRVHLRRGHPRQYAPGKFTWVQACAVGNRAAGVVHKDYKFSPQAEPQGEALA